MSNDHPFDKILELSSAAYDSVVNGEKDVHNAWLDYLLGLLAVPTEPFGIYYIEACNIYNNNEYKSDDNLLKCLELYISNIRKRVLYRK